VVQLHSRNYSDLKTGVSSEFRGCVIDQSDVEISARALLDSSRSRDVIVQKHILISNYKNKLYQVFSSRQETIL